MSKQLWMADGEPSRGIFSSTLTMFKQVTTAMERKLLKSLEVISSPGLSSKKNHHMKSLCTPLVRVSLASETNGVRKACRYTHNAGRRTPGRATIRRRG